MIDKIKYKNIIIYMKFKKIILFLLGILLVALVIEPFIKSIEGFSGINNDIIGIYPRAVDKPILDDYPLTNEKDIYNITNNSVKDIWREFPVFSLPSFKQITNNFKYYKIPDDGTCTPPMFCNAFYKEKKVPSNEVYPLPPVINGSGSRVGYFRSE
jgi:hypothetical protein